MLFFLGHFVIQKSLRTGHLYDASQVTVSDNEAALIVQDELITSVAAKCGHEPLLKDMILKSNRAHLEEGAPFLASTATLLSTATSLCIAMELFSVPLWR